MRLGQVFMTIVVVAYVGLELSTLHTQRYRTEPLFQLDEYTAADTAWRSCGEGDAQERERFESNYAVIQRKAGEQLLEVDPDLTESDVTGQVESLISAQTEAINALLSEGGCEDRTVWRWVKLHEARARLNLK